MSILVGTSGFSHTEWKRKFYSDQIRQNKMLAFYRGRFSTVEVNNTFRQHLTSEPSDGLFVAGRGRMAGMNTDRRNAEHS